MNNSSTTADLTLNYQYIAIGSAAIVSNLAVLVILISNNVLMKKSAFFAGMAVGDVLDGVALLGNGVRRLSLAYNGISNVNVHPFYCMSRTFTPVFVAGNQLPGVMFFLIGLERYLAVRYFDWYFAKWTKTLAWTFTAGAYFFCALSLTAAFLVAYFRPNGVVISISCATPSVVGPVYSVFNYGVTLVGGTVAVTASVLAMVIFTKRKRRLNSNTVSAKVSNHVKKQWSHTRIVLCIAVVDMGLVVLPNFLLSLSTAGFGVITISNLVVVSLQVISARSCFNLFAYLVCNQEFRAAALKLICLKKYNSTNGVQPISMAFSGGSGSRANRSRSSIFNTKPI